MRFRLHQFFEATLIVKAINAGGEILASLFFFFVQPDSIRHVILFLIQPELNEDPTDLLSNYLLSFSQQFSLSSEHFVSFYLFWHGLLKLALIIALWKKKWWAYPCFIGLLLVFAVYQVYRFAHTFAFSLIVLTVFDLVVAWLTWLEYQEHLKKIHPTELVKL